MLGGDAEGGNLQTGVSERGCSLALLHEGAVLEGLVADGKLHELKKTF